MRRVPRGLDRIGRHREDAVAGHHDRGAFHHCTVADDDAAVLDDEGGLRPAGLAGREAHCEQKPEKEAERLEQAGTHL
jgi:hypothetical protein